MNFITFDNYGLLNEQENSQIISNFNILIHKLEGLMNFYEKENCPISNKPLNLEQSSSKCKVSKKRKLNEKKIDKKLQENDLLNDSVTDVSLDDSVINDEYNLYGNELEDDLITNGEKDDEDSISNEEDNDFEVNEDSNGFEDEIE